MKFYGRQFGQLLLHDFFPKRSRSFGSGEIAHGGVVVITDPDAYGDLGSVADCPGVFVVLGGSCFCGYRVAWYF